jgi:aspartate aminotransferase-like enzyme
MDLIETAGFQRHYFDLRPQVLHNDQGYFPYTPALAHLFGLREALEPVVGAIDVTSMRHANELVDLEGNSRVDAARWLRTAAKLEPPP